MDLDLRGVWIVQLFGRAFSQERKTNWIEAVFIEQMAKVLRTVATVMLILVSTACTIVHYSYTSADQITLDRPLTSDAVLSIYFPQSYSRPSFEHRFAEPIQKGLVGAALFQEAAVVTRRPDTGRYVSITIDGVPTKIGPSWKALHILLGVLTHYAIPYYGVRPGGGEPYWHWTSKPIVMYTLNVDQVEKGVYCYPLDEKVFRWILAPSLIHWFLSGQTHQAEAITSTARQFVRDAQRDGHW